MSCVICNLALVCLEIVFVLVQIGAQYLPNTPYTNKTFWKHMIVLQAKEVQVEARFGLFGDSANLDAR